MTGILQLLIVVTIGVDGYIIKGFRYEDNKATSKWVEGKNGFALAKVDRYFPDEFSVCVRVFSEWNRHGHRVPYFDVNLNIPHLRENNFIIDFHIHATADVFVFHATPNDNSIATKEYYHKTHDKPRNFPFQNMLRKWVHFCTSYNRKKNSLVIYRDGRLISKNDIDITQMYPVGYFEEEFRLNKTYVPGYNLRLGLYPMDNQPLFGYIADVNAWDRVLSTAEMERYSNCMQMESGNGNLVDMESEFIISGTLISFVTFNSNEMDCRRPNKDIFMATGARNLNAAVKQCDKFMKNSLGPFWRTQEDFWRLRSQVRGYGPEGLNEFCWHGGRNLFYVPYIKKAGKLNEWLHLMDNSPIGVNTSINYTTNGQPSV